MVLHTKNFPILKPDEWVTITPQEDGLYHFRWPDNKISSISADEDVTEVSIIYHSDTGEATIKRVKKA